MKVLLTLVVAGLFVASSAAFAGEGVKKAGFGGCGYGATKTVSPLPTHTPVPIKSASKTIVKPAS